MSAAVVTAAPSQIQVSDQSKEADYEDDFEDFDKELDSFIEAKQEKPAPADDNKSSTQVTIAQTSVGDFQDAGQEKGSEEIEKGQKEYTSSKTTLQSEGDDYSFSDDQKRAMLELIAQRQENDFPEEDPPEYDVRDRLIQLNAELAQESAPAEREHKVGFKETLVDLVAPPPDFSDDEDSQRDKMSPRFQEDEVDSGRSVINKSSEKDTKKSVVVEREGKFEVVNIEDLTPIERELLNVEDPEPSQRQVGSKKTDKNTNNSYIYAKSKQPSPPRQPRPSTANGHTNRRALRPVQQKQRPQSAAPLPVSHGSFLENFSYNSPYALTPQQKEMSKQKMKALDDMRREEERRKKEEKEIEKQENEEAFQAWLKKKREEDRKKKEVEEKEKREQAKEDRKEENEHAFRAWLKEKRVQLKHEKLLKRRQNQEMKDGYNTVSREECDKAFKEWVKKKNSEIRKSKAAEKQKGRSARSAAKRSRKAATLLRAIRNSQSFQVVNYYGYRF